MHSEAYAYAANAHSAGPQLFQPCPTFSNLVQPNPTVAEAVANLQKLVYFGPGGGKSTLEKQKTQSKQHVMKT